MAQKRKLFDVVWLIPNGPPESVKTASKDVLDALKDVIREEKLDADEIQYLTITHVGDIWV